MSVQNIYILFCVMALNNENDSSVASELLPLHASEYSDRESDSVGRPTIADGASKANWPIPHLKRSTWGIIGLILIIAALTIVDVVLLLRKEGYHISQIEVSFDQSADADVSVSVTGSSANHPFMSYIQVTGGECSYYLQECDMQGNSCALSKMGDVTIEFKNPFDFNTPLDVQLLGQNTNYHLIRQVYEYVLYPESATTQSSITTDCHVDLDVRLWHAIPISDGFNYAVTTSLDQFRKRKSWESHFLSQSLDQLRKRKSWESIFLPQTTKRSSVTLNSLNAYLIEFAIVIKLSQHDYGVDSLIVNVPSVSYSSVLVDDSMDDISYLVVENAPFSIDLVDHTPQDHHNVSVSFSISCESRGVIQGPNSTCSLLAPLDVATFHKKLVSEKFINATMHSNRRNFFSQLLGEYHFIRTVNPDQAKQQYPTRMRHLVSIDSLPVDPSISTGADCVILDVDTYVVSNSCLMVEKGFFKLFIETYDDNGLLGKLQSVTSWANGGGVAFVSDIEASYRDVGSLVGGINFSEDFENMTMIFLGNSTTGNSNFLQELFFSWNFEDNYQLGLVHGESLTYWDCGNCSNVGTVNDNNSGSADDDDDIDNYYGAFLDFNYGDNLYDLLFFINKNITTAAASGTYGGNFEEWYFQVLKSSLLIDGTEEGYAMLNISYAVPSDATTGRIEHSLRVLDGVKTNYLNTTAVTSWNSTDSSWSSAKFLHETGIYFPSNDDQRINVSVSFGYGSNKYALSFWESSTVSEHDDVAMSDDMSMQSIDIFGTGGYGGSSTDWYMT